jgi:uncharacterized protein YjbJ (UPF0337 family)
MSGKSEQVKGRAEEAAGILTGNKDLESEGKTDRRTGEANEKVDQAKEKVDEVIDKATAKVEQAADRAKDSGSDVATKEPRHSGRIRAVARRLGADGPQATQRALPFSTTCLMLAR